MNAPTRKIIFLASGLAIAGSFIAFAATGMHPYTRFRDKDIEAVNAESDLSDLFAETGSQPPPEQVESVNAIGFLPSGPGLASLSVVTVSGPALLVMGILFWHTRRTSRKVDAAPPEASAAV